MKCDKVNFHDRSLTGAGMELSRLLSEITVAYEYGEGNDRTMVTADLGSLLRDLAMKVDRLSIRTKTRPTLDDLNRENGVSIVTAVPKVHVRQLEIRQWLQAMNIPFGVPFTAQFVDDLQPSR